MKKFLCLLGLAFLSTALLAETTKNTIDLNCESQASQLIEQLSQAGLLVAGSEPQARTISLELCTDAEQSAQAQHEEGKKEAIENWFFESTGGKPGNERLKRLKR